MTTRRERLHKIWEKLEHTMLELLHVADEVGEALADARNSEQVEILRDELGIADLLHEVSDLLLRIQGGRKGGVISGVHTHYLPILDIDTIDTLAEQVREILDNGFSTGPIGESER